MSLRIKSVDIARVKCDVIVNSLGEGQNVAWYGEVCEAILRGAASHELISQIHSWENVAVVGRVFLTDGYNLPSKKIIHVVTPFYRTDKKLKSLEFIYKIVLVLAYKNGWKNIALPLLGTGANGYPHAFVLKMITNLCGAFVSTHPEMEITICMPIIVNQGLHEIFDDIQIDHLIDDYFKENARVNKKAFSFNSSSFAYLEELDIDTILYSSVELLEDYLSGPSYKNKAASIEGELIDVNGIPEDSGRVVKTKSKPKKPKKPKELLLEGGVRPVSFDMSILPVFSISCYIDKYIELRYEDEEDRKAVRKYVNEIISGDIDSSSLKTKHNVEEKRTTVPVPMLMRYVLALRMTLEEANDLLCFCGRMFSPISKQDRVYVGIIKRRIYDIYIVNGLCLKANVEQIFGYDKVEPKDLKIIFDN